MPVYKDKKRGTYYVSVYVETRDGERKKVMRRGFKSRQEAKKAEAELIFNASFESSDNPTFAELAEEYLAWYKQRRKASSYRKIESMIRIRLIPYLKNKKVQDITKRDVMRLQNNLLDKYEINSAKRTHAVLSSIFNYAIKVEYLTKNVAREVGNIQARQEKRMDYWTIDEFKKFIKHVDDLMYMAFFMCLFFGGFRKGELLAITWKDINFDDNTIDVNKTVSRNNITSPKNESSNRVLKMPNHTMNLLRQLKLNRKPKADYFVFGEYYNHLHESTLDRKYDEYIKKSKVKRIRIHDFRHSHASYLINNKYDIQIVSKRLGHSNVSTTYDIYSHLYPNKEDDAIAQMEADFKPADIIKLTK